MAHVTLNQGESIDSLLKRFKREVSGDGTMAELKERSYFQKPSTVKREKIKAAIRRRKRNRRD